jgi:hypothetical protein
METTSSYYDILSVEKTSTFDEIKKAYRKLAKEYHPDVKGGNTRLFQEINTAFQVLSNPGRRAEYDYALPQQASQANSHTYQRTSQKKQTTNEYEYPLNEDASKVVFVLNKLKSYTQISEILLEIRPLMEIVRVKSTKNDYLNFSSMITILLMNIIINDANQMMQNYHAYVRIDEKGLKLSYQKLKEIGKSLVMDNKTRNIYSKNKRDLESILHNCSGKKHHSIAKTAALIVIIFFAFFAIISCKENLYACLPLLFIVSVLYKISYFILLWIVRIMDSIYWNIKILFT